MRSILLTAGLIVAVAGLASRADAAPITYTVSATGSGTIGATSFTNKQVTFTGTGNTANITSPVFQGSTFYANPFANLTVNIAGIGTATVTDFTEIFGIPFAFVDPDGEIPPIPLVIFGRLDPPFNDPLEFTGMGAVGSNLLAGYNLSTAISVLGGGGVGFIENCGVGNNDPCLHTTLGLLSFTTNIPEGQATFTATLTPVPEPATDFLLGGGLTMLGLWRARLRSRR
jgi:hypothetical protein